MSTPKAKPYKLKPSEGVMTRDDVSLWEYTLLASCRQIQDWQKFLPPSGEQQRWTSLDEDEKMDFTMTMQLHNANSGMTLSTSWIQF